MTDKPDIETCAGCDAFSQTAQQQQNRIGQCRRHSPVPLAARYVIRSVPDGAGNMVQTMEALFDSYWPVVPSVASCKEFKRRATNGSAEPKGFAFVPPVVGETSPVEQPLPGELPPQKEETKQ